MDPPVLKAKKSAQPKGFDFSLMSYSMQAEWSDCQLFLKAKKPLARDSREQCQKMVGENQVQFVAGNQQNNKNCVSLDIAAERWLIKEHFLTSIEQVMRAATAEAIQTSINRKVDLKTAAYINCYFNKLAYRSTKIIDKTYISIRMQVIIGLFLVFQEPKQPMDGRTNSIRRSYFAKFISLAKRYPTPNQTLFRLYFLVLHRVNH